MKHLGDITKINGAEITPVDCITFGAPCQDLSVAGARAGMKHEANGDEETTRSGLFFEAIRIIEEMRENDRLSNGRTGQYVRPRFAIYENVPGAFSSNGGKDFQAVLNAFVKVADPEAPDVPMPNGGGKWTNAGCLYDELGKWSIAWRVSDGQFWGATQYIDGRAVILGTPQRRKRISVVADFGGRCAPEVLFERKGLSRHFEQSGAQGQGTSGGTERGSGAAGEE